MGQLLGFDPTPFINADKVLEQRVAALEATVDRLLHPPVIAHSPPMSDEDAARFREEFEAAAKQFPQYEMRLLPSSLPNLPDPETIRHLLRECVTAVKPGEVLFFTAGDPNFTPGQIREIQDWVNSWLEYNAPDVRVLVLMHGEMAVAEAPEPGFLKDCRVDVYRHERVESVKITHLPTGTVAVAPTKDEAVAKLGAALIAQGDISINQARLAHGLPEWDIPEADTAQALPQS